MPTENDYIDVRDLFVSINPTGLDQSELARDGASFVEPQTINDYHLFRAGYQAALEAQQGQGEPLALPKRKGAHLRYDTLMPTFSKGWNACLDEIAKLGPLYTHPAPGRGEPVAFRCIDPDGDEGNWHDADPASLQDARNDVERGVYSRFELAYKHSDPAEVERLQRRVQNADLALKAQTQNCDTLRDQLAERDTVIEQQKNLIESLRSDLVESHSIDASAESCMHGDEPCQCKPYKSGTALAAEVERLRECAHASKTESAPVAIDERKRTGWWRTPERDSFEEWAAEEAEVRGVGSTIGLDTEEHRDRYSMIWTQTAWMAWQARAALERKP